MTSFAVQPGRHALSERGDDLYSTPACATESLLRVETLPQTLWEPACGRGAISRVLEASGHTVVSTDLVHYNYGEGGRDFLLERAAPPYVECIVTNPPFKLSDQFVRHGLFLVPKVVVLLRWAYAEGAGRSDLIDQHLSRVWLGRERLPMMHRDGWDGPRTGSSGAPFAWFVFERRPMLQGAFLVRRMSWRG
ncbi:MAG: hypothetical protein K2P95_05400 [Hyphomonadaceae bacterium]|nr:hypothetical protein [Hyphomonadaceae bacterium]